MDFCRFRCDWQEIKKSDYLPDLPPYVKKVHFLIHSMANKQEVPNLNSAPSSNGKKDFPSLATIVLDFVNKPVTIPFLSGNLGLPWTWPWTAFVKDVVLTKS